MSGATELRELVGRFGPAYARINDEHVAALAETADALLHRRFAVSGLRALLSRSKELSAPVCRLLALVFRELVDSWCGASSVGAHGRPELQYEVGRGEDLDEIAAFHIANHIVASGSPPAFELYQMQDIAADFTILLHDDEYHSAHVAVARRATDGLLVGCAAVVPPAESGGLAHLKILSVARAYRGLGIGRSLVERCLDHARAKGAASIQLICLPAYSPDALHLYLDHGFVVVDDINPAWSVRNEATDVHESGECRIVTMVKDLKQQEASK